ncbi:MAG: hypothetical protein A2X78_01360 [Gammaproteobacteria bacterium GWE2_37_16]|nr:MAG: hypothetical protein A2X78_01360 [Gammaproteobacteria bacterium GWE2_37_16]
MFSVPINIIKKETLLKAIGEAIKLYQPLNEFMIRAVEEGYLDIVQNLIERGVPFVPQGAEKMRLRLPTANLLVAAAKNGYRSIVQALCPICAAMILELKDGGFTPESTLRFELVGLFGKAFREALATHHFDIAKIMLDYAKEREIDIGFESLIESRCEYTEEMETRDIKVVEFVISNTPQDKYWNRKSEYFDNAVRNASIANRADILKILLDTHKPISDGHKAIYAFWALYDDQPTGGATFSILGDAFAIAASKGYADVVRVILESGRPLGVNYDLEDSLIAARRNAAKKFHTNVLAVINSFRPDSFAPALPKNSNCVSGSSSVVSRRFSIDGFFMDAQKIGTKKCASNSSDRSVLPIIPENLARPVPSHCSVQTLNQLLTAKLEVKCEFDNVPGCCAAITFSFGTTEADLNKYARELKQITGIEFAVSPSSARCRNEGRAPTLEIYGKIDYLTIMFEKLGKAKSTPIVSTNSNLGDTPVLPIIPENIERQVTVLTTSSSATPSSISVDCLTSILRNISVTKPDPIPSASGNPANLSIPALCSTSMASSTRLSIIPSSISENLTVIPNSIFTAARMENKDGISEKEVSAGLAGIRL